MKSLRKLFSVVTLVLVLVLGMSMSAFASSQNAIFIGEVGFSVDTILNNEEYKIQFAQYMAQNMEEKLALQIVLPDRVHIFEVNKFLNDKEVKNAIEFAEKNPFKLSPKAVIWNGEGNPGEAV